jgi:adenylate kinase
MPHVITIIGPPAAGKSTLTKFLRASIDGTTSFSVRSFFGRAVREGSALGLAAAEYVATSSWIPDELVASAASEALAVAGQSETVIFEGMPGNRRQAELLDGIVAGARCTQLRAIHLDSDLELCIARSRTRLVCLNCDDGSWPATESKEVRAVCAHCGGSITPRPTDEPGQFRKRLQAYRQHGPELLSYYQGPRLIRLDARQPAADVGRLALKLLRQESVTTEQVQP